MATIDNSVIDRFIKQIPEDLTGKDAISFLIKNKIVDEKRIRNYFIRQDFLFMFKQQKKSHMYIYNDLSFKYDVSVDLIRKIING